MKTTAVIMAGGRGERFWPKSRYNHPKQFLSLTTDGKTMLQKTVDRLKELVNNEDIFIVTNENYTNLVTTQLPDIPPENILGEPCGRNTAPCIGLAACTIRQKYGDAIMLTLPSDHLIRYTEMYTDTLQQAIAVAQMNKNLVTIGIPPTHPETGYGYIHFTRDPNPPRTGVYRVKQFVEKPDYATAQTYVTSGHYLWNSGMFVWKTSTILDNLSRYCPDIYARLTTIEASMNTSTYPATLATEYEKMRAESIDFGVMEHASDIYTIAGNFGWDDVGSLTALERINPTDEGGNYTEGDTLLINTNRSIICGKSRLIATLGVEDLIVIDTDDALLICQKDAAQDIKKITATLQDAKRNELL